MYLLLIFILILGLGFYSYNWKLKSKKNWSPPKELFPTKWRIILNEEIPFYRTLNDTEKEKFEFKVQEFLLNCSIIGVGTEITIVDKVLVASSAIIPIFGFENWQYHDLHEVLIYPGIFNKEFETEGPNRTVLGMVGTGYMDGKMILSQEALTHGFDNKTDKKNTAIHEFAHLIDKRDGAIIIYVTAAAIYAIESKFPQQSLYFFPLSHGHGHLSVRSVCGFFKSLFDKSCL